MAIASKNTTSRSDRPSTADHDTRVFRHLVGDLVEIYVAGARSFIGVVTAVDGRSGLLHLEQLADRRGVMIRLDRISAVEQACGDETWSLAASGAVA